MRREVEEGLGARRRVLFWFPQAAGPGFSLCPGPAVSSGLSETEKVDGGQNLGKCSHLGGRRRETVLRDSEQ